METYGLLMAMVGVAESEYASTGSHPQGAGADYRKFFSWLHRPIF